MSMSTPPPNVPSSPYGTAPGHQSSHQTGQQIGQQIGSQGGQPGGRPASPGYGPTQAGAGTPGTVGGGKRGLLWGVGGAVLASVVWTAALLTVPDLVSPGTGRPASVGSYRVVDNLCETVKPAKFSQLYPAQSGTPYHYTTRHAALDDMYCSQYRKKLSNDSDYVSLYLDVQLHRKIDPKTEFEAQRSGLQQRKYEISEVPNLGEDAYVGYLDDTSGSDKTWHYLTQVLYVRQGGMTYYASWSGSYQEGKTATVPDRDEIRQALLIDSRDALKVLGGRI
ncbi:hypothetical protein [Kitasatospora sp. NPDC088346]|uniref:hypothetical protein n=1 Tax=Kitasatospora sp. NPDC088346 TaxID=3364073 RepID=UPI0038187128